MAIYKKGYYDLYMYQGDSGNITIKGLPPTENFNVHLDIYNDAGDVFYHNEVMSEHHHHVVFPISANESDEFEVGNHFYAVKLCLLNGTEETVIPPLKNTSMTPTNFKNKALFMVYPKQIEGD